MLAVVTVAIIFQREMFSVVVLTTIYSFLMASVFIVLDAVDVAMTEAAVGAGISTVLLLAALQLIKTIEMRPVRPNVPALMVATGTGVVLIWGALALPSFGVADSPIHTHVAPRYLSESIKETGVPNVVTSVLADYRSFDTLGETTVIFTAGIGVMLLLRGSRRKGRDGEGDDRS
jgi:multicomponent Na+:H+ antiporter subunit B